MQRGSKKQKVYSSNCYNLELRDIIAWRIASERRRKFPDRGGLGKCARAFGTSDQQWSQYENGRRTPDDERLGEIAAFFGVSLEHLKTAPDSWETLRNEWQNRTKPGRREVARFAPPPSSDVSVSQGEQSARQGMDVSNSSQATIPIVDLIQKIIDVENMHEHGEIPTATYRKTMATIDSLIGLVAKKTSRPVE